MKFEDLVKTKRKNEFIKPYDLAYNTFLDLEMHKKGKEYFFLNASVYIENMRNGCWNNFLIAEDDFSKMIYKELNDQEDYEKLSNREAVNQFIKNHIGDFYTLSLSNTQSRRSRAGTEFEAIIELLFMGSGLMLDSQGSLSSGIFEQHSLGKAVDIISPGVLEYSITKRNCSLISCKTSLRERWAEVIEEKERTGASEIYLATLDHKISSNTLKILNDKNVIPVVTKKIKETVYQSYRNVITFEELLQIIKSKNKYWKYDVYSPENLVERIDLMEKQLERHRQSNHKFVCEFYYSLKAELVSLP